MKAIRTFLTISLLFIGCSCGGGGGESSVIAIAQEGEPCTEFVERAARGLSCLHCNHPRAIEQARQITGVLRDSCLQRVGTNFLVDGTFGFNPDLMREIVTILTEEGRSLEVTYFIANGPAQRRFSITANENFGVQINPGDFRNLIFTSDSLRREYQELVSRLRPTIEYSVARGATVVVVPYLEDNLSDSSFREMVSLTREVIGDLPVSYGRNPCLAECFIGNQGGIPSGVRELLHTIETDFRITGGIVSNDGFDYNSPATENNPEAATTLAQLGELRNVAEAQGNNFVLWSAPRQGLPIVPPGIDFTFPTPDERNYRLISPEEREELIRFLRE